jgi:cbb3-type cytochrome oxidase subunit 3
VELNLLGASLAFYLVFGAATVVFVGLSIYVAIWAFRRASQARKDWVEAERQMKAPQSDQND